MIVHRNDFGEIIAIEAECLDDVEYAQYLFEEIFTLYD